MASKRTVHWTKWERPVVMDGDYFPSVFECADHMRDGDERVVFATKFVPLKLDAELFLIGKKRCFAHKDRRHQRLQFKFSPSELILDQTDLEEYEDGDPLKWFGHVALEELRICAQVQIDRALKMSALTRALQRVFNRWAKKYGRFSFAEMDMDTIVDMTGIWHRTHDRFVMPVIPDEFSRESGGFGDELHGVDCV